MSAHDPNSYQSIRELADEFQVSDRTIRRRIKEGSLIAHRFGHLLRVSRADKELFVRERRGLNLKSKDDH